jgi:hypothetical protein
MPTGHMWILQYGQRVVVMEISGKAAGEGCHCGGAQDDRNGFTRWMHGRGYTASHKEGIGGNA